MSGIAIGIVFVIWATVLFVVVKRLIARWMRSRYERALR